VNWWDKLGGRLKIGRRMKSCPTLLAALVALTLSGCGYHVSGKGDLMPKDVHTIYVAPFDNMTSHYRLTDAIPEAISRELMARTRYQLVKRPEDADAVLKGAVISFGSFAIMTDSNTGRAVALQVSARIQVTLTGRASKVLYTHPAWEFHQRYQLSTNATTYFDESGAAELRMSQDIAGAVVSGILENF